METKESPRKFTMQIWEAEYKGHTIRVESGFFRRQLLVDNEIQDARSGLALSIRLLGRIRHGEGVGEPVMVGVRSLWPMKCEVTVNGIFVAHKR